MIEVTLEDFATPTERLCMRSTDGTWTRDLDLDALIVLARRHTKRLFDSRILEIGTAFGETTRALADACSRSLVYTVGVHSGMPGIERIVEKAAAHETPGPADFARACIDHSRVCVLPCDTRVVQLSPLYDTVDLAFVDADHRFEAVQRDTIIAARCLRDQQSCVAWHDCPQMPGVLALVDQVSEAGLQVKHLVGSQLAWLEVTCVQERLRLINAAQRARKR